MVAIEGWDRRAMELRHLRYFVAVAEELNFTRAAKRLGINQPPLSLQIQQLEKELDVPLFRRLTRGVELTDAGKLLLEEARIILKQVETAKVGVRRRARGETGHIIFGTSGSYFHPLIVKVLGECKARYPNLVIAPEVEVTNIPLLIAWLRTGRVDACLVPLPIDDIEGLAIEPLIDEDCVIALPRGHPLANSASVPLVSLAKETFVLWYRGFSPNTYDSILAACNRAGFVAKIGQQAPQVVTVIPLVAAGFGVSIVPRSFSELHVGGVTYIDIEGEPPRSGIGVAFRGDEKSPALKNVMKVVRVAKLSN
jgi:DNA-binding transcriptional LysR family regulator